MKKQVKLEVNKHKLVCPLGLGYLGECLDVLGLNITQMCEKIDENPFKWTPIFIYESVKYSGVKLDFELNDLVEWLDEDPKGYNIIGEFNNAFTQSILKDVPKQEPVKGKKQPKKK